MHEIGEIVDPVGPRGGQDHLPVLAAEFHEPRAAVAIELGQHVVEQQERGLPARLALTGPD